MDVSASTATAATAAAAAFCFKSEKVYFLARISVTTYIFRAASHEEYTRVLFLPGKQMEPFSCQQ